ncbi:54S ribosomal protein L25, mitochondrial [Tilletia horrida]|uniref:54S ribosomal protein L25, mitochondrial n=1 Tax=Tilletia horrida TaxID=155126 RepID=A0AAN6GEY6_9BASI|nr:54S ribosomal protein L25, mitochondrial [Tilletia horrida]KAK0564410.1 54S ribosomal protein L25, mitochondrial [Tilletia horrida]
MLVQTQTRVLARAGVSAVATAARPALTLWSPARWSSTEASTSTSTVSSSTPPAPAASSSSSAAPATPAKAQGKAKAGKKARQEPVRASERNPFLPFKNRNTGRWIPAMSLRRQAQLTKAAHRAGMLDQLPPGPKVSDLRRRIARNAEAAERETRMAAFHAQGGGSAMWAALLADVRAKAEQQQEGNSSMSPAQTRRAEAQKLASDAVAAQLAHSGFVRRGPYAGRNPKKMFKGHKPERQHEKKLQNRADRMAVMDETVREWRQAKADAKKKLQPTLPY